MRWNVKVGWLKTICECSEKHSSITKVIFFQKLKSSFWLIYMDLRGLTRNSELQRVWRSKISSFEIYINMMNRDDSNIWNYECMETLSLWWINSWTIDLDNIDFSKLVVISVHRHILTILSGLCSSAWLIPAIFFNDFFYDWYEEGCFLKFLVNSS